MALWRTGALHPGPREPLHPRGVGGVRVQRLHHRQGPRRLPPVVPENLDVPQLSGPGLQLRTRRGVASVAVHHQDPPEPVPAQTVRDLPHHPFVRPRGEGDGAGIPHEVGRQAEGEAREDRNTHGLRRLRRHPLRQDHVHRKAEVGVLLRAPQRKDAAVVPPEVRLHLHPRHLGDAHRSLPFRRAGPALATAAGAGCGPPPGSSSEPRGGPRPAHGAAPTGGRAPGRLRTPAPRGRRRAGR